MNVFRRYWSKFRYNKKRRERIIGLFDTSDDQFEFYLGDEFVPWQDEIEGVKEFLAEIEAKELLVTEEKYQAEGTSQNTIVRKIKGDHPETDMQEI